MIVVLSESWPYDCARLVAIVWLRHIQLYGAVNCINCLMIFLPGSVDFLFLLHANAKQAINLFGLVAEYKQLYLSSLCETWAYFYMAGSSRSNSENSPLVVRFNF